MKHTFQVMGGLKILIAVAIIGFVLGYSGVGTVRVVHAQTVQPQSLTPGFAWEYRLDFSTDSLLSANQLADNLAPSLNSQGVASGLQSLDATNYRLTFSGSQNLEQVRQVLYSPLLAGFINGAAEVEVDLPVGSLLDIPLMLDSNPSTGYKWDLQSAGSAGFVQQGKSTFTTRSSGYGVPGEQTLMLHPSFMGDGKIRLIYRRPFEPAGVVTRHLRITMAAQPLSIDLSDPQPVILGPLASSSTQPKTPNPIAEIPLKGVLPSSWDWRTAGILPAVRNQGSCGSCWAFGTVGVMESAILKAGGPLTDLSEQFLVSCNTSGWDCGGGWTATKYHFDTPGKNQTAIGAVLEADKPYSASNGNCNVAYNHPYKLSGWQFIVATETTMPTVEQIKNAIFTYGPITAGVCADEGWDYYSGGVYTPTRNDCQGSTDHQIVLVGWEDATQSWILRNSWGPYWGENGYMHIRWDPNGTTSRVGEGTSWVRFGPAKSSPANGAVGLSGDPTLSWNASSDASSYEYCIDTSNNAICNTSWTSTNTATSVPLSQLASGSWFWQVRARNANGTTEADAGTWSFFFVGQPYKVFIPSIPGK